MTTAISVEDMRSARKLFTLPEARAVLATTEPLAFVPVQPGSGVRFRAESDWNDGIERRHGTEPVGVHVRLAPSGNLDGPDVAEHQLSKDAVISALKPTHMSASYAQHCPGQLLEENLNYWYRTGLTEHEYQLMTVGNQAIGQAVTKESLTSFSNLELFDRAVARLTQQYPADSLYVDVSKLAHSLRRTFLQFVIPAASRQMVDTGTQVDNWWAGVQLTNSQTGEMKTTVAGYFFRPICTNGMVDTGPSAGTWSRRAAGSETEEVYDWAARAVEEVLGGLEHTFDLVQATTQHRLDGEMGDVVGDVFDQFRLPARSRSRVVEGLVESDDLSMYAILNAVTRAANDAERPEEAQVLMSTGGELAQHSDRCDNCHRILV